MVIIQRLDKTERHGTLMIFCCLFTCTSEIRCVKYVVFLELLFSRKVPSINKLICYSECLQVGMLFLYSLWYTNTFS